MSFEHLVTECNFSLNLISGISTRVGHSGDGTAEINAFQKFTRTTLEGNFPGSHHVFVFEGQLSGLRGSSYD